MTYSMVVRCRRTGMFGAAVLSSSPAPAARCLFAEQGIGAVATQNLTDPALGTRTLDLMRGGAGAIEAISILKETHRAHGVAPAPRRRPRGPERGAFGGAGAGI